MVTIAWKLPKIVCHVSDGKRKINRGPIVKSSRFDHWKLVTICELTISQFVNNFMVSTGWYCYWYGGGEKFIQNKNITTTTIGTITLGLNNMFVFETFVEHHLELTLGTDVQFKPLQGQIIFTVEFPACNTSMMQSADCSFIRGHFVLMKIVDFAWDMYFQLQPAACNYHFWWTYLM